METKPFEVSIRLLTADDFEPAAAAHFGGKAAMLARLGALTSLPRQVEIPPWFVVTPPPLDDVLMSELTEAHAAETGDQSRRDHLLAQWTPALHAALDASLDTIAPDGALLAVRSSAVGEDAATHSFAGQFESFLNVPQSDVVARIVDVWLSGLAPRVLAYRREQGLEGLPPLPSAPLPTALVQRMVVPDWAGVAFSADPVSARRSVAVVAAVAGLADRLVAGSVTGETFAVAQDGTVTRPDNHSGAPTGAPLLADAQIQAVAGLARTLADALGQPQDIEWAIAAGKLYLLQARPITTLYGRPDPDGAVIIWDNSNIIESYGGTTTPLTYSFARRAYTDVYQTFCAVLGVDRATIQANQHVFANMIGLVQGRIYYNLLNWYRVLALLPGFRVNRTFMEQMMGVKEGLPARIVDEIGATSGGERLRDLAHLLRTLVGLVGSFRGLEQSKSRFLARLAQTLGPARPDLSTRRADELAAYYRQLEADLLPHWDAPLVNDFFAMIFFGLLRKLCAQWVEQDAEGAGETLHNNLLVGEGGMISAEPAQRVADLALLAHMVDHALHPAQLGDQAGRFVATLAQGRLPADFATQSAYGAFRTAYRAYLDRFGDRCMNELKLESRTLFDDPAPLLRAIGQLAQRHAQADIRAARLADGPVDKSERTQDNPVRKTDVQAVRRQAEAQVEAALVGHPLRRRIFAWVLRNARDRVRDRENLRFERTRVFGRARQIFRELGKRLYATGRLADADDVFYLQVDEVLGFVEGTTTATALDKVAAVRRAEFDAYRTLPAPPRRFVTFGAVHAGNDFQTESVAGGQGATEPQDISNRVLDETVRMGLGCCPGVVRGRARVVDNPLTAQFAPGDILVAPHTDPSWILIMPLAAGLLVERGSLLSHAAIVARELGIPAVVAIPGVMEWLRDGDWVELDGATGRVQRISSAQAEVDIPPVEHIEE